MTFLLSASRFLVLFPVLVLPSLCAQGTCDLDARNRSAWALPGSPAEQVLSLTGAAIRHGFNLVSVQNKPREAQPLLRQALARARSGQSRCGEALAEFGLGQVARSLQLSEAMPHFLRAQQRLTGIGTPLALAHVKERIASTQYLTGQRESFLNSVPAIARELREAGDPASAIRLLASALLIQENGAKVEEMEALLHELESISTPNKVGVRGYVEWTLASTMLRTAPYAEINSYFDASIADLTACACQPQTLGAVYVTRSVAADVTSDGAAMLRYARKAEEVYRINQLDSYRAQALELMAVAFEHLGDDAHAIIQFQAAVSLAEQQRAGFLLPKLLNELAGLYGNAGRPLQGIATQRRITGQLSPFLRSAVAGEHIVLEDQAGNYAETIADGQAALKEFGALMQTDLVVEVKRHMADAELRTGHAEEAVDLAREAVMLVDQERPRTLKNDAAEIEFNDNQVGTYSMLIRALVQAGKPEEALLASEQSRARAFVDLTSTAKADPTPGNPGELASDAHPFTLTAEEMHTLLDRRHATLLSYWLGEGRLYTWVLAPGQPVKESDQPIEPAQLAMLVRATLPRETTLAARGPRVHTRGDLSLAIAVESRKPWRDLYSLLIAPIAAQLPAEQGSLLTIVPQASLFQLSFSALLDAHGKYLVEQHAINTTPSIGMLAVSERNRQASSAMPSHYVVLANPALLPRANGAILPPLPGTEWEAQGIVRSLGRARVTLLTGSHASIEELQSALPQATVVHFATHAVVSDQSPSTSFLALDSHRSDGKLTLASVYGLRLHARLVVLSACGTGRGKITGDGVSGLSRAFVYAGASSLVTTLWDVVDEPTAHLMPTFYAALAKGESESVALREAQLNLIESLRRGQVKVRTLAGTSLRLPENPSYWAAFSLSGQP